jgi:hypothetical protein
MTGWRAVPCALLLCGVLVACTTTVTGTASWPGARLEKVLLTAADFPDGVQYDRIVDDPAESGAGSGPPPMLSRPEGCSDGLTRVIESSAQRGPGSAAKYVAAYDGARAVMTVLTWRLDVDQLAAAAERCARYETFFDLTDVGIPMTTTRIDGARPDALVYRQTMTLSGVENSVYFSFENIGTMAVFGIAFPTPNPGIAAKGGLPQTFLDIATRQAERIGAG